MKMAIGSTKAGLDLKEDLMAFLDEQGHDVDDLGMQRDGEFVPYHTAAGRVASAVSRGEYEKAIIICGTGGGSVVVANKFKGVHAVPAGCEFEARGAAAINRANVLVLGEWVTPAKHARAIVQTWLETPFGEGFAPEWREFLQGAIDGICEMEDENFK